jgi:hypothetical protein
MPNFVFGLRSLRIALVMPALLTLQRIDPDSRQLKKAAVPAL